MRWLLRLALAGLSGLACVLVWNAAGLAVRGEEAGVKVKEGQPAPDVELPATQIASVLPEQKDARVLRLSDFRGKKNVVLYFYPKAMTPGCTKESCAFRDRLEQFAKLDTVVIGISTDNLQDQERFTDKEKLNFPLLADSEGKVAQAFGVLRGKIAQRATFIIDKEGKIVKIYPQVRNAAEHPEEVLTWVREHLGKR
jgi:peroxiredoxin Q/BCP